MSHSGPRDSPETDSVQIGGRKTLSRLEQWRVGTAASIHPFPRTLASCPQHAGLSPATHGGLGLTWGWPVPPNPLPRWLSLGPWEEVASPTCPPFSPAAPMLGSGDLVPGVLLAALGAGGPPCLGLQGDSPTFPPPSAAGACAVSPNPPLPPEAHPSLVSLPQAELSQVCSPPRRHTPLKSPPLFLPITKSRCEASAGWGQGGNPSIPASSTSSSDTSELKGGEGVGVLAGPQELSPTFLDLKDWSVGSQKGWGQGRGIELGAGRQQLGDWGIDPGGPGPGRVSPCQQPFAHHKVKARSGL